MKNAHKKSKKIAEKRSTHKRVNRRKYIENILEEINKSGVKTDAFSYKETHYTPSVGRKNGKKREENVARGTFSSSKSGFGFVSLDNGYERDIFIPEDKTLGAIEGDTVEISYHLYRDRFSEEKSEGRVLKIVEFGMKTLIGTVTYRREGFRTRTLSPYLYPDDPKVSVEPQITELMGAKEGDKVQLLLERHKGERQISGRVIANFGNTYTKEANYLSILSELEIPTDFSREELLEAEFFALLPISDEGRVRRDSEIIFTIDSESAKDLDDAISLRRLAGGDYQLSVHIADVSYYVKERSHLDRAVMSRGTSVYFTDRVVPMLPPSLSNGACSLNPGEDKYALSAIIHLDQNGEIVSTRLEKSIIKSRIKGIYSEINSIFENRADKAIRQKYKEITPTLLKMHELYLVLLEKSKARGALELEGAECEILLDQNGDPADIIRRTRGDAEKMIEQFMLTANEAVARLLSQKGIPCVYRVHDNPPPERLFDFLSFTRSLGLDATALHNGEGSSKDYADLLAASEQKGLLMPVSTTMLRSMAKAKYSEVRQNHFGLGLEYYCHFTSPIRRLSDLATHRIIHRVLFDGKRIEAYNAYARRAARAASDTELRAISAERRIENLYKVIYMSKNIGCRFDAIICSVTSFGFFVRLDNTCEGLVPLTSLYDSFIFEERTLTLRSAGKKYAIGDTVRVVLEEADMIHGKLRFSVI